MEVFSRMVCITNTKVGKVCIDLKDEYAARKYLTAGCYIFVYKIITLHKGILTGWVCSLINLKYVYLDIKHGQIVC